MLRTTENGLHVVYRLGTTSAGIALSLGRPDGERISREAMLEAVARIARAVAIPVTADLEAGYGATTRELAETVRAAIRAGAVGMNVEDSMPGEKRLLEPEAMAERVRAIRAVGEAEGLPFVINARTDVYLRAIGEPASRFEHAVRRANLYREASADCLFVPGVTDAETIGRLAPEIRGSLNILAGPGCPATAELERLGVARVSMGSGPMRATLALLQRIARELAERGTYRAFTEGTPSLAEFNRLFE